MFNSNASSADAGGVNYIEDVFSTWLYTGNDSTQTITNGIDLAGEGGLVWIKSRTLAAAHYFQDTVRGANNYISSNATNANTNLPALNTVFNSDGFSQNNSYLGFNNSSYTYASWTFRKQPKFFDVVTYTGNGSLPNQLISHNLGSVPGCIIIKATNATKDWIVWHRGNGTTNYTALSLNLTAASTSSVASGDLPTATQFKPGAFFDPNYISGNETGVTYVAYVFAHNAGGFGLTGTDNVITCGSFSAAAPATVSLGFEPQFLMLKDASSALNWSMFDTARGFIAPVSGGVSKILYPNTTAAEGDAGGPYITSTGFTYSGGTAGDTIIYIAIRRGPMKVPTSGTSVYKTVLSNPTNSGTSVTGAGFPPDLNLALFRDGSAVSQAVFDRLRGGSQYLATSSTAAEGTVASNSFLQDGFFWGSASGESLANTFMRRAPSFFDEVCYTGTGANRTVEHNLTVAPELMIIKGRNYVNQAGVYANPIGATKSLFLFSAAAGTAAATTVSTYWNNTAPTSSVFTVGTAGTVNDTGSNFVAYLFATCAGVSKVGGYTGTGTTLQIDCGFTAGARFVLIKRTDSTGSWYVWDSARGIVAGNDPYLLLNSTAAEVTSTDYVDTYSAGFELTSTAPAALNASGGTYIFLAIA